jgi:allophanate hydrolase
MPSAAPERGAAPVAPRAATVSLAVVAAHRTGQPLHSQLLALGSSFVRVALTAPVYRLIALPGPGVPRGGIVATAVGGTSVEVELHELPVTALGELLCALPAPLALGRVELLDDVVLGMVCSSAPPGSLDISAHRSWLSYLAAGSGR